MAFNIDNFDKASSPANTDQALIWAYESSVDSIATIKNANYFLPIFGKCYPNIQSGELLYVRASDGVAILNFDTVNSTSVTTSIYRPNPNPPLPTYITGTTSGSTGTTTKVFPSPTLTFVPSSLLVQPINLTNPVTVIGCSAIVGEITVVFSGDPGGTCICDWAAFE